jgi:DnaK suppressor protein
MTPPNTTLSTGQIDELRTTLERTLKRIERSLEANGGARSSDMDQSTVGRLSRIEALQNKGLTENLHAREQTQLDELMQALGRLDDGSYGICTACSTPIRFERLVVFPEARTCSPCSGNA